jgi:hypothetical protein
MGIETIVGISVLSYVIASVAVLGTSYARKMLKIDFLY